VTLDEARDSIRKHVVYSAVPGDEEEGVIDSVGRKYVYVRYVRGHQPVATLPENLTLMRGGSLSEHIRLGVEEDLLRAVLEAVCVRDGISLESAVMPGESARNYELAVRLGIGHVFGLEQEDRDA